MTIFKYICIFRLFVDCAALVRRYLKLLLGAGLTDVINVVFLVLRRKQVHQNDPGPDQVSLHLHCLKILFATVQVLINLMQIRAIMRAFWVSPACYLRCVLCLLNIDAIMRD